MLDRMTKDKERWIPKEGYNVVGVDDFELPGEQLYLVGHYADKEAAEEALKRFQDENPGHTAYVYGSKDG